MKNRWLKICEIPIAEASQVEVIKQRIPAHIDKCVGIHFVIFKNSVGEDWEAKDNPLEELRNYFGEVSVNRNGELVMEYVIRDGVRYDESDGKIVVEGKRHVKFEYPIMVGETLRIKYKDTLLQAIIDLGYSVQEPPIPEMLITEYTVEVYLLGVKYEAGEEKEKEESSTPWLLTDESEIV